MPSHRRPTSLSICLSPPDSACACVQTVIALHKMLVRALNHQGTPLRAPVALGTSRDLHNIHHDMVNERPKQFGGTPRSGGGPRPGYARPNPTSSPTTLASRATQLGIGLGRGAAGLGGLGKGKGVRRHQWVTFWQVEVCLLRGSEKYSVTRFKALQRAIFDG